MESCFRNFAEEESVYVVTAYWISMDCIVVNSYLTARHTRTYHIYNPELKVQLFYSLNESVKNDDIMQYNDFKLASGKWFLDPEKQWEHLPAWS